MIRQPISRRSTIILGVVGVVVLAGAYTLLSHRQHQKNPLDRTIPGWGQMVEGLRMSFLPDEHSGGSIWVVEDSAATFGRLFSGLGVAVLGSLILGLLMGCYTPIESLLQPVLSFLAKIPATAMMAVFFVTVGLDFEMYVTMIAFGVLPTLAQSVYLAAKNDVPDELVFKAYTLGASQVETIWNVIYKHVLPKILDGIRLQVGPAMVFLIAAEWMVGDVGFGYRIKIQQRLVDMRVVYPYLVLLGSAGLTLDLILAWLRRKLCPWYSD